jgi:hypothetical protein
LTLNIIHDTLVTNKVLIAIVPNHPYTPFAPGIGSVALSNGTEKIGSVDVDCYRKAIGK